MPGLSAFFDRDVFIKLACCDLWPEMLEAFSIAYPYRLISSTAKASESILKRFGFSGQEFSNILARIDFISRSTPVISVIPEADLYNKLFQTNGIDAGARHFSSI